ncbi:MAG: hypothetical protein LBJ88_03580 [Campylobacteraceae bacterium]|nr:hypothetical protein [Campylobacteraceae bacterium]
MVIQSIKRFTCNDTINTIFIKLRNENERGYNKQWRNFSAIVLTCNADNPTVQRYYRLTVYFTCN